MNTVFFLIFLNMQSAKVDTLPIANNTFLFLNTSTSCISCYYLASKEINELVKNYTVINLNILTDRDFFAKFINDYNQDQMHRFASDSASLKSIDNNYSQTFNLTNNEGLVIVIRQNNAFVYPFENFFDQKKNFKKKSFLKIIKEVKK